MPPSPAKPTLLELIDALSEIAANWYDLGMRLGVPIATLDAIRETNKHVVGDCLREMLKWWMGKHPERGWSDIIHTLREMNRNDVADEVQTRYTEPSALGM